MLGRWPISPGRVSPGSLRTWCAACTLGLLVLGWSGRSAAQTFPPTFHLTTGGSPVYSTAVGDFNNDTIPDLVTANSSANSVSVFLGRGGGGFGPRTDFPTGTTPTSVVVGDLNGDLALDLVVANNGAATISVLLGTGSGTFGTRTDFSAGANPKTVALGDLDADGFLDVAVTNHGSNTVSVLLGTGSGGFGTRTDYTVGTNPWAVAIGDLNVDGRQDLVVTNVGANTMSVLLGTGGGAFGPRADYGTWYYPYSVAIGDLSGDGRPEVVVATLYNYNYTSGIVSIYLGTGNLSTRYDYGFGGNGWSVAIGELNGDSKPDVAVACGGSGYIVAYFGTGVGTFGSAASSAISAVPVSIALADLNADGKLDIATGNNYGNTASVLLSGGAGSFSRTAYTTGSANSPSTALGDLNGDGALDIVTLNSTSNTVSVLLGTGTGSFGPKTDFATGANPICVAIATVNGDTLPDVVVANHNVHTVSILLGTGSGSLGPKVDFAVGSNPYAVALADLNNDGKTDLVTANTGSHSVTSLLGIGDGNFGSRADFPTGTAPVSVAIADLSGDTRPDIAVANASSNSVSVLLGTGAGGFQAKTDFPVGSTPYHVAIADLSDDGNLDLAVTNVNSSSVSVLLGAGTGSFGTKTDFNVGAGPYSTAIGDINGDGRPDLATASHNAHTLSIQLGSGGGSFGPMSTFGTGNYPYSVAVGDLNSDGRLDAAVTNFYTNAISVLLALSTTHATLTSTPNPSSVGGAVTLTATLSTVPPIPGPPTGSVNFFDGFTLLGTAALSGGVASITAFPSAVGTHRLTAVYGGTSQLLGSITPPVMQVVRRFYEIVSPNGGEQWTAGTPVQVRWRGNEPADLAISHDGGYGWSTLASGVGGADENAFDLTAPGFGTILAKVRVTQTGQASTADNSDQSDGVFTIVLPTTPPAAAVRLQGAPAGQAANDNFGLSVASAGDFNGDGFADQIVGAYLNDAAGTDAGRAYIYFGGPGADAVADVTLTGQTAGDRLGVAVAAVGDVNRDGYDDVLVGADRNDAGGTDAGRAYLYHGGASPNNVADLTMTGGAAGDYFGVAVAGAGDVNDDGYADFLIGASVCDGDSVDAGAAYLYLGGPTLDASADWTVYGEGREDYFGFSVSSAGDVNGDRFADFLVGAYQSSERLYHGGKVYLYLGGRPPDTTADLELHGRISEDFFGVAVAGAGDVDGDGFGDMLVGAQGSDAGGLSSGVAYLFLGGPDLDATPDVTVVGYSGEQLGRTLAGIGDVNNDGYDDFATGSRLNDDAGIDAGRVSVYYGGTAPDATADVILSGEAAYDTFGRSVAGAGDVNGDGFDDLIAGADRNDHGALNAGRAYIHDFNRFHLLTPTGGDTWPVGATRTVQWLGETPADLWLSADGGQSFEILARNVGGENDNTVALRVPHLPTRFARLQVRPSDLALAGSDQSDSLFTIEASVALLSFRAEPGDGGTLVTWSTNPTVGPDGLAGYRLYRLPPTTGEDSGTPIGPVLITEPRYLDAGAPQGSGYRLCAVNGLEQELEVGRIAAVAPFAGVRLWPSPARAGQSVHLVIATPFASALLQAGLEVAVFDVSGRRVATVQTRGIGASGGRIELDWDGRDDFGRAVPSGIYFVSVRANAGPVDFRSEQRLVVTR